MHYSAFRWSSFIVLLTSRLPTFCPLAVPPSASLRQQLTIYCLISVPFCTSAASLPSFFIHCALFRLSSFNVPVSVLQCLPLSERLMLSPFPAPPPCHLPLSTMGFQRSCHPCARSTPLVLFHGAPILLARFTVSHARLLHSLSALPATIAAHT